MSEIKDAGDARDRFIKKALTESAFKKALLADPNAAIEKELGVKLPDGVKVVVVEDTATTLHLVLPTGGTRELPEADLEKVSGGNARCGNALTFWTPNFFDLIDNTGGSTCGPFTRRRQ